MPSILHYLLEPENVVVMLVAVAAFATVVSFVLPLLTGDRLGARMKYVSSERERLRVERIASLAEEQRQTKLRREPKSFMKQVVEQLNLRKALETEDTREKLKMAGLRGQAPVVAFLFFRAILPVVGFLVVLLYLFFVNSFDLAAVVRIGLSIGGAYLGFYFPNIFISNLIQRRQKSMKRVFPDALDLLLICVQAGMSVEAAMSKVASEIGPRSIELAEEFSLTTAELSYLQERRQAYENLGKRTGLAVVRSVGTSLIQAERYGTAVSQALRVLAKESRDMRMSEAEKKAAALPPKLTVPMILFFLPVLFVVILGPAALQFLAIRAAGGGGAW
jgi:tight adherence protein C